MPALSRVAVTQDEAPKLNATSGGRRTYKDMSPHDRAWQLNSSFGPPATTISSGSSYQNCTASGSSLQLNGDVVGWEGFPLFYAACKRLTMEVGASAGLRGKKQTWGAYSVGLDAAVVGHQSLLDGRQP